MKHCECDVLVKTLVSSNTSMGSTGEKGQQIFSDFKTLIEPFSLVK